MFITFIYTAALFIVQKLEIFADLSQIDWYEEDIDLAISQFQRVFFLKQTVDISMVSKCYHE